MHNTKPACQPARWKRKTTRMRNKKNRRLLSRVFLRAVAFAQRAIHFVPESQVKWRGKNFVIHFLLHLSASNAINLAISWLRVNEIRRARPMSFVDIAIEFPWFINSSVDGRVDRLVRWWSIFDSFYFCSLNLTFERNSNVVSVYPISTNSTLSLFHYATAANVICRWRASLFATVSRSRFPLNRTRIRQKIIVIN